jgi:hypothetical protein
MGHKNVCFNCRTAFNVPYEDIREVARTTCGVPMAQLPHRFRPPKKGETPKLETVKFLVENGFPYHQIYRRDETPNHYNRVENYIKYPENMKEAREFVVKYTSQAKSSN